MPETRKGWRTFECTECNYRWEWPTRDRFSPSGENCPYCREWCTPCSNRPDSSLPVDDRGNLTVAWDATPGMITDSSAKTDEDPPP